MFGIEAHGAEHEISTSLTSLNAEMSSQRVSRLSSILDNALTTSSLFPIPAGPLTQMVLLRLSTSSRSLSSCLRPTNPGVEVGRLVLAPKSCFLRTIRSRTCATSRFLRASMSADGIIFFESGRFWTASHAVSSLMELSRLRRHNLNVLRIGFRN